MKKSLAVSLLSLALFVFSAGGVAANEGVFRLAGPTATSGRCFAASIYVDTSYKILMTCRGLSMAADPVLNKYLVWAQVGEKSLRLGEIVSGKLAAATPERFDSLYVTLEAESFSSKPTGATVLSGRLEAIDFGTGLTPVTTGVPTLTATPTQTISERGVTPTLPKVPDQGRLTSLVVGIGRAILFGFILLLIIVGVMSFLARRKNL